MHFSPRMTCAIRLNVFSFDEATKIQWALDLFETAPLGTQIDYSPEMTRLLERLYRWADLPVVEPVGHHA